MKQLFILLLIAMAAMHSAARTPDVLTATLLTPEGETQIFKGAHALAEAYDAAPAGSTITLSPGTFDVPRFSNNYRKPLENLTLIGSGIEEDSDNGIIPTVLVGTMSIGSNCIIEGVRINDTAYGNQGVDQISNVQLTKCHFNSIFIEVNTNNFAIRQCVINDFNLGAHPSIITLHNNLFISNSHICYITTPRANRSSSILVDHSFIYNNGCILTLGTYTNSIMRTHLSGDAIIKNCILLDGAECDCNVAEFVYRESSENLFKEPLDDFTWETGKSFRIKHPENNWANDGTEIGLYGGLYPFNLAPRIPRIVECEVDRSVVMGGKLKMHVKVEAQTED